MQTECVFKAHAYQLKCVITRNERKVDYPIIYTDAIHGIIVFVDATKMSRTTLLIRQVHRQILYLR